MNKQRVTAMLLALGMLCAGCSKPDDASSAATSSEAFKTADELIAEAEQREQEASAQSVQEQAAAFADVAGKYVCSLPEVDVAFFPTLELDEQGKAVFHANIFAGMGKIEGSYTFSGTSVQILVDRVEFSGFAGDKVTELYFNLLPDGGLELSYVNPETPVGVTNAGDKFTKENT